MLVGGNCGDQIKRKWRTNTKRIKIIRFAQIEKRELGETGRLGYRFDPMSSIVEPC
jgi:hypothetical protein